MKIPSRTFQLLVEQYEDHLGVNYERMWRSLVCAQGKTGRYSQGSPGRRIDSEPVGSGSQARAKSL